MTEQKARSVGWAFAIFGVFEVALGLAVWLLPAWCMWPALVIGIVGGTFFGRWLAHA